MTTNILGAALILTIIANTYADAYLAGANLARANLAGANLAGAVARIRGFIKSEAKAA